MRNLYLSSALLFAAAPAAFAETETAPAARDLAACISITADAERLACYDTQAQAQRAAAPAPARQADDASDGDGNGFSLGGLASALSPFGGDEDSGPDTNLVTSSLRDARAFVPGRYRFTLENGQVWEQTTSADRLFLPANAAGLPVEIVAAPLGGYFIRIGDRRGVRVNRVQ